MHVMTHYHAYILQYAVLEDNAKVNGMSKTSHSYPSQTLGPIWMLFQLYHYVRPGSRYAKLDLNWFSRCHSPQAWKKTGFGVSFFVNISLYLSVLRVSHMSHFSSKILSPSYKELKRWCDHHSTPFKYRVTHIIMNDFNAKNKCLSFVAKL